MTKTRKLLAFVLAACMLFSMAIPAFAEDEIVENMTYEELSVGANALTVEDANAINIYYFSVYSEDEVGTYKFTTNDPSAVLYCYSGSTAFWQDATANSDYDPATNSFTHEVKYVGAPYLVGVKGASSFTINVEYLGNEIEFDPATLPYEQYVPKVQPTEFTLELAEGASIEYVDVFEEQSVFVDADGYYHLGAEDGPVLYVNISGTAPYISLPEMVSYGQLRFTEYDENGEFVAKYDFTDCFNAYDECKDKRGLYPMTVDLEYMLKNVGEAKGWYKDDGNGFYIFGEGVKIVEESGWLFSSCYVVEPEEEIVFGDATGDGQLTAADVNIIVRITAGSYLANDMIIRNCDCNADSTIDAKDLNVIKRAVAGA